MSGMEWFLLYFLITLRLIHIEGGQVTTPYKKRLDNKRIYKSVPSYGPGIIKCAMLCQAEAPNGCLGFDHDPKKEICHLVHKEPGPEGYLWMEVSPYFVSDVPATWSDADAACKSKGYILVDIKTYEQNLAVTEVTDTAIKYWTGGRYLGGKWKWSDGGSFFYTNWHSGHTSGTGCLSVNKGVVEGPMVFWHQACTTTNPYICKRP